MALLALVLILVIGVPAVLAMVFDYMQKMERIKRSPRAEDPRVLEAVEALRREIADLRDTSTSYDLSFDQALQRLEGRVHGLERRVDDAQGAATVRRG